MRVERSEAGGCVGQRNLSVGHARAGRVGHDPADRAVDGLGKERLSAQRAEEQSREQCPGFHVDSSRVRKGAVGQFETASSRSRLNKDKAQAGGLVTVKRRRRPEPSE